MIFESNKLVLISPEDGPSLFEVQGKAGDCEMLYHGEISETTLSSRQYQGRRISVPDEAKHVREILAEFEQLLFGFYRQLLEVKPNFRCRIRWDIPYRKKVLIIVKQVFEVTAKEVP